jgi:hypothetical protein
VQPPWKCEPYIVNIFCRSQLANSLASAPYFSFIPATTNIFILSSPGKTSPPLMQLLLCRPHQIHPLLSPATSVLRNFSTVSQPDITRSLFDTSQSPGKGRAAELHHPRMCPPKRCNRLFPPIHPSCMYARMRVNKRLSLKVPALGPLKKSASAASSASASEEPDMQAQNSQHPAYDIRHGEDLIKQVSNSELSYSNIHPLDIIFATKLDA